MEKREIELTLNGVTRTVTIVHQRHNTWRAEVDVLAKFPTGKAVHRVGYPYLAKHGEVFKWCMQHVQGRNNARVVAWANEGDGSGWNAVGKLFGTGEQK